ncbi:hypothetical protein [Rhizosphaericola mali]|uniref:Tetratricopeptide repeat protein n=1 Tax=Rhizosphaericola mali TaxID=2545455 RepID=A0A5P2G095_9BACT|nr:hypothetical protein [Rhizosphaericola mali]QES87242.1 hypothetical protein E0W69_000720 [Rhizosphaericola mali]
MKRKKLILPVLLLSLSASTFAQKLDKDKLTTLIATKKLDEAKTDIDKVFTSPEASSNPEALAYKIRIYGEIVGDSTLSTKYPDAKNVVLGSFGELQKVEPDTAKMNALMKNPSILPINGLSNVYTSEFNVGREAFNNKDNVKAFNGFNNAQKLGQFFIAGGFLPSADRATGIDTLTTAYAGFAAQNAVSTNQAYADSAAMIYEKLASRKIKSAGGADMLPAYQFMVNYYETKKDDANFQKALALGKELYPSDAYWGQEETRMMTSSSDPNVLLTKYAAIPNPTEEQAATFASSFGEAAKDSTVDPALKTKLIDAEVDAYQKAFTASKNGLYGYNAGIILMQNRFYPLDDAYRAAKGETADLKAKRAAIEKEQKGVADTLANIFEETYTTLKGKTDRSKRETVVLGSVVDRLAEVYGWQVDKARGHDPKAYDKYNALFKKYSAEHGTYNQ